MVQSVVSDRKLMLEWDPQKAREDRQVSSFCPLFVTVGMFGLPLILPLLDSSPSLRSFASPRRFELGGRSCFV